MSSAYHRDVKRSWMVARAWLKKELADVTREQWPGSTRLFHEGWRSRSRAGRVGCPRDHRSDVARRSWR